MRHTATCALLLAGMPDGQDCLASVQAREARRGVFQTPAGDVDMPDGSRPYDSGGRRDPFVRPTAGGRPAAVLTARPRGLAGIAVDELTLRGLVLLDGEHFAVLETEDGRSYLFRGGEELFDGYVESVAAGGVVMVVDGRRGSAHAVRRTLRASREGR